MRYARWSSRLTWGFLPAAIVTGVVNANPPPLVDLTEMMMHSQSNDSMLLARMFGPDSTPINFTATFDENARRFSYSTDPNSTYLGMPLSINTNGSFDAVAGQWVFASTGHLGAQTWTGDGTGVIEGDPTYRISFTVPLPIGWGIPDAHFTGSITTPTPPNTIWTSSGSAQFTLAGVPVGSAFSATDTFDTATGRWSITFANVTIGTGFISPSVPATSTFMVPSPSAATVMTIGVVSLLRRNRRSS